MVQKAVTQLMGEQSYEHRPRDLVAAAFSYDVALFDLDDIGIERINSGYPGTEQNTIAPVPYAGDQQETADPGQRSRNEITAGGVPPAPGAPVHSIVHPATALGTLSFEITVLVPAL
jgi:hypothetical protein